MQKLRIAFLMTQFPTPGSSFIYDRIIGLLKLGHEVFVFAKSRFEEGFPLHESFETYGLMNRVAYFGVPTTYFEAAKCLLRHLVTQPRHFFQRIAKSLSLCDSGGYLSAYFAIHVLSKYDHIDILFGMSGPTSQNNLFFTRMFPEAKFVANFYGFDFSSRLHKGGRNMYERLFKEADLVISQSYYSRDCIISLGCPSNKVIKHPFCIDFSTFDYRERSVTNNNLHFITVGRFVEKKAHRITLTALSNVLKRGAKLTYHVVGEGPLLRSILDQVESDVALKEHVIYHGYKTQQEISALLRRCHVFLQPSITAIGGGEQEDTPTTLLEAQASGLPVIATYHAGIPEVVLNHQTGLLVPERSVHELERAIEFFIDNPDNCGLMGAAARRFIQANFDMDHLSRKLECVFYQLLNSRPGTALGIDSTDELHF